MPDKSDFVVPIGCLQRRCGTFHRFGCGAFKYLADARVWCSKGGRSRFVSAPRMWAAVLACVITTLVTLAVHASQPAALSTTLLVAIDSMHTARDVAVIAIAVVIIAILGEPIRHARLARHKVQ